MQAEEERWQPHIYGKGCVFLHGKDGCLPFVWLCTLKVKFIPDSFCPRFLNGKRGERGLSLWVYSTCTFSRCGDQTEIQDKTSDFSKTGGNSFIQILTFLPQSGSFPFYKGFGLFFHTKCMNASSHDAGIIARKTCMSVFQGRYSRQQE